MKKILLPVGILALSLISAKLILDNPPEANRKRPSSKPQMSVEAISLTPQTYQVQLDSYGTVRPRIQSLLISQASGQINYLSENFREGGFFEQGEVLLRLDNRDQQANVQIAQANLLDANRNLAEEQARAEQAMINWQRLGNTQQPNDLVLRKPQLDAAQAKRLSAQAQLTKEQLNLERTEIIAPYTGRVLQQHVDLGQVISNNNQLAVIFSSDSVEVRLPIKNQDLSLIDLPQDNQKPANSNTHINRTFEHSVALFSSLSQQQWQGRLIRTEAAINESSQQLYVVAKIENPYQIRPSSNNSIKIGQYVSAQIAGKKLKNVIVIPTKSIYQGSYVYIVENGLLLRKDIELLWKNTQEAVVKTGLSAGQQLVITALGQVSSGTPVVIADPDNQNQRQSQRKVKPAAAELSPAQPNKMSQRLKNIPAEVRQKLTKEAEERGISLEQLMQEKRKNKQGDRS